jgi:hypothetical protein
MAKKFALVTGLYNIFNTRNSIVNNVEVQSYNINSIIPNGLVDKNTIGFYYANGEDIGRYIGEHKITDKDRFIITQNDVFSLFGSPEIEPVTPEIVENTWRPILINGDYVTGTSYEDGNGNYVTPEEPFSINYINGNLTTIESSYDAVGKFLSIKYNIDEEELINFIKENIGELTPEVGNGKLSFEFDKSTVHTENDIEIENPKYDEEDPTSSPTIITHDVDINQNTLLIEGDFTANSVDDSVVRIKYKGTADRVDWFVENDSRDDKDTNNSTAKKFLYIECLQEYFQPSADYPFLEVKDTNLISQDSIVFITCGSIIRETELGTFRSSDAEIFDNPEYTDGARFIWTQNMMFSANTWMPIFTRETSAYEPESITPVIGNSPYGGRLIIQGAGGITVDNNINDTLGTHDRIITISGKNIEKGIAGGLSLENGKATKVQDISEGKRIDVKIESEDITYEPKYEASVVETINTNKNFIRIKENPDNPNDSWLEVNGVDSKSIIIEEEIPIGGTIVGENVITSGSFAEYDDRIPIGMSLHEVLYRILYKEREEIYSYNPELVLKAINNLVIIKAYKYDNNIKGELISNTIEAIPGTKFLLEISKSGDAEQYVIIKDLINGYKIDNGPKQKQLTEYTDYNFEPTSTNYGDLEYNENSDFEIEVLNENSIVLTVKANTELKNIYTAVNKTTPISGEFTEYTVYPLSNLGNYSDNEKVEIAPDKFNPISEESQTEFIVNIPAEDYGTQTANYTLKVNSNTPSITVKNGNTTINKNSSVYVETPLTVTIKNNIITEQKVEISSYVTDYKGGYKIDDGDTVKQNKYTESYTPEYEIENKITLSNLDGTPNDNTFEISLQGGGTSTISLTNNIVLDSEDITEYNVYAISNWGNKDKEPITINKNNFNNAMSSDNLTKTINFNINPKYPYFIGTISDFNNVITDFSIIETWKNIANKINGDIPINNGITFKDLGGKYQFFVVFPSEGNTIESVIGADNANWFNVSPDNVYYKSINPNMSNGKITLYNVEYSIFSIYIYNDKQSMQVNDSWKINFEK